MSSNDPAIIQPDLDTKVLSDFIYELNIARRHLSAYPPGHPIIDSSMEKVLGLLERLFEFRDTITFGIAKNTLLFEQEWLDKKNPVFRDFASTLSGLGAATISFHRQPSRSELLQVCQLFSADRQSVIDSGGFEALLPLLQVYNIEISAVDYSAFHATEEDQLAATQQATYLWENFLNELLCDTSEQTVDFGSRSPKLDPAIVANILNNKYQQLENDQNPDYEEVISFFVRQAQQTSLAATPVQDQFAELISQLTPELRRQFLNSTFRSLDTDATQAEAMLDKLPTSVILDTLEDINQNRISISGTMVNLLGKLAEHQQADQRSLISGEQQNNQQSLKDQLHNIFREEDHGKFNPESYQLSLNKIVSVDQALTLPKTDISALKQQLQNHSTERHSCAVILRLLQPDHDQELADSLQNNLIDLARYFLEVGDFKGLRFLHGGLLSYLKRYPHSPPEQTGRLFETLADPQFQTEVLDNLQRWSEAKQDEIRSYIQVAGETFARSLIERLADEPDKALRRLYLNTLVGMGKAAHQAIYNHFDDDRWYLIRNLLSVLRLQQDSIILEEIYKLESHPHLRVNQELLKLLFKYDRERADTLLLKQLSSNDPKLQAHAIQLAELSRNPEISEKLLSLLQTGKITDESLPLKTSIIRTLGQVGSENALPVLEKLLFSGRLLKSARRDQLKSAILENLGNYPYQQIKPLLIKLTSSRQGELSRLAAKTLRQRIRS